MSKLRAAGEGHLLIGQETNRRTSSGCEEEKNTLVWKITDKRLKSMISFFIFWVISFLKKKEMVLTKAYGRISFVLVLQ